jgi:SAM-dependent methyltransferase
MPDMDYDIWKATELTEKYLSGVRGAIPLAKEQIDLMLRIIGACDIEVERILDLGCGDGILAATILQHYTNASGVLLDISEPMIQAALILVIEYLSGWILIQLIGFCPWDYTGSSPYAVDGLIRLDFSPFWLVAGLIFERIHDSLDQLGFPHSAIVQLNSVWTFTTTSTGDHNLSFSQIWAGGNGGNK